MLLAKVMAFLSLSWGTKPTAPWGLWRGYPREQGSSSAGRTCPGRTCTLCSHHRCAGKKYAAIERGQLERDVREHTRCPADSFPCIGSSLLELQNFHETFESDFYPIPVTLYFGPIFQYFTNQECLSHTSLQLKKALCCNASHREQNGVYQTPHPSLPDIDSKSLKIGIVCEPERLNGLQAEPDLHTLFYLSSKCITQVMPSNYLSNHGRLELTYTPK